MIGYVLLSYGARPTGNWRDHPAARAQIANLVAYAKEEGREIQGVSYDHCRRINGLSCLPKLETLLAWAIKPEKTVIVMDDMGRLFANCSPGARQQMFNDIEPYADALLGLRQGKRLSRLGHSAKLHLAATPSPVRYDFPGSAEFKRRRKAPDHQTDNARRASRTSRKKAADAKARELDEVRRDLRDRGEEPSFAAIADEANARGLRTTRSGPWRRDTVRTSLKRLEQPDAPTLVERAKKRRKRRAARPHREPASDDREDP